MIFIFEDKESDLLSQLFVRAYKTCSFKYVNGNGNIVNTVKELLSDNNELITVFLDVIPDNKDTINIYNSLRRMSLSNNLRIIILPLVCSEYYFILSLPDFAFTTSLGLEICKSRGYWRDSKLIDDSDKKFTKNFEKYCKLILLKSVKDCIKHSRKNNAMYGIYYCKDCLCNNSENECRAISLENKAINYVSKYPLIPTKGYLGNGIYLTDSEIWHIHRHLVDEFNSMVDRYKLADKERAYSKIMYVK